MLQSRYKFNSEISAKASKLSYKSQNKKKELFINISIPLAIALMIGILIYDIIKSKNFVFDIILLVLLIVVEAMNISMPHIIYASQKRYLKKLDNLKLDYCIAEYDNGKFKEKYYKDKEMIYFNEIDADKFSSYSYFENYIFIFFNNFLALIFDLNEISEQDKQELIKLVEKLSSLAPTKKRK